MKIRGIEISIKVWNTIPAILGVIPLDIEVPAELAKTGWTPLEVIVTVLTSTLKSGETIRIQSTEQDPSFRIDENTIRLAVMELYRRVEAARDAANTGASDRSGKQAHARRTGTDGPLRWGGGSHLKRQTHSPGSRPHW